MVGVNGTVVARDGGDDDGCGRVWGLRPASLVTQVITVGALVSSVLMPVIGSVADHSPRRRSLGRHGLCLCWLCTALQIGIDERTWKGLMCVQATVFAAAYLVNSVCAMSYMAELTPDNGDALVAINARARAKEMGAMLAYLAFVTTLDLGGRGQGSKRVQNG